jgi:signal transduction histidine kinase
MTAAAGKLRAPHLPAGSLLAALALAAVLAVGAAVAWPAVSGRHTPGAALPLASAARVLRDASRAASLADVRAAEARGALAPLDARRTNFGHTADAVWLVMPLPARAPSAGGAVLELTTTPARADLYVVAAGGRLLAAQRSGTELPFPQRPVQATNVAFPIAADVFGAGATLYLRVQSTDTLALAPLLWEQAAFERKERSVGLVDGAYYGALFGLLIYNLFLFFGTADANYLAYVVFELLVVMFQAVAEKYAFQYLWPAHPGFTGSATVALNAAATMAGLAFGDRFLALRDRAPRIHRAFLGLLGLGAALLAALAFGVRLPSVTMLGYVLAGVVVVAVAGALVAARGDRRALLFLVAWSFLLVGTVLAALSTVGLLQDAHWFLAVKVGSALEATLMSLVLAHRIAGLQRARERAQADLIALRTAQAETLEHRVGERTAELTRALLELQDAHRELARQARLATLGRMVAGVAHEVGNPLNFLRGGVHELDGRLGRLTEQLGERERTGGPGSVVAMLDGAQRALTLVRTGADRIDRIVRNLRGYVQRDPPPPEPTDVVATLESTLALLDGTLRESGIVVAKEWSAVPAVLCIPGQLGQVFANLVINACEAMPSGGSLFISCRSDGDAVSVVFRDSGPGVPADTRDQIFEPFVTGRPGGHNSGLGLYVCHEIVSHNGGAIWLDAEQGPGAVFCVSLPRDGLTAPAWPAPARSPSRPAGP